MAFSLSASLSLVSSSRSPPESPLERAKALALRVLAFHARTEAQLRARLARAGLADVADEAVAWLARLGYLDDRAFARVRARSLVARGRCGPRLAKRRLADAGVSPDAAEAAVSAALADAAEAGEGRDSPEVALCRVAVARKLRGAEPPPDDRARARLARFLLGRGFSAEAVRRVLGLAADAPDE
jgi:regulatory protein